MKKALFLWLTLCSLIVFSQTTSGGPDNFGYTYKNSLHPSGPSFQWFDITQIGIIINGLTDDNFVGPYTISGFPYYSGTPTNLYIGSNGYISFDPVNIASSNAQFPQIPLNTGSNHFIAALLTDFTFSGTGNAGSCFFYNQGDTICVTFDKVPFWVNNTNQYAGDNSFQVLLNKRDSSITFNYLKQVGTPDPTYISNFLTIGIENNSGNDGLQYFRGTTFPSDSFSIKFEYPTVAQAVIDLSVEYIDNIGNNAIFLPLNGTFSPTALIKNVGNQDVKSSITVTTVIRDPAGITAYNAIQNIDSLKSGNDSLKTFRSFNPNLTGRYSAQTYVTRITGDFAITNDTSEFLILVVDTTLSPATLDYTDGVGGLGIGWAGGNGGCGLYIEPPYYPARIVAANFFITAIGTPSVGFHSIILDDNGRQAGQGTTLDSTFVNGNTISVGVYNRVPLATPIVINSGGVYLYWLMDGPAVNLSRSFTRPASRQTFEVIFGSWSEYRDKLTEDFLMNIEIEPLTTSIKNNSTGTIGTIFPNPSSDKLTVIINSAHNEIIQILNVRGRKVNAKMLRYSDRIEIIRNHLPSGTYFISVGQETKSFIWSD
jgi:hypothetical protein